MTTERELTMQALYRYPITFSVDGEQYALAGKMYTSARGILQSAGKNPFTHRLKQVNGPTYEPNDTQSIFMMDFSTFITEEIEG